MYHSWWSFTKHKPAPCHLWLLVFRVKLSINSDDLQLPTTMAMQYNILRYYIPQKLKTHFCGGGFTCWMGHQTFLVVDSSLLRVNVNLLLALIKNATFFPLFSLSLSLSYSPLHISDKYTYIYPNFIEYCLEIFSMLYVATFFNKIWNFVWFSTVK